MSLLAVSYTHLDVYKRQLLRLLQIGIPPDKPGYPPRYDAVCFPWGARENRWLSLVSGTQGKAPITIRQDVSLYAAAITGGKSLEFHVFPGRQSYLVEMCIRDS